MIDRRDLGALGLVAVIPALALALYASTYGWARTSGRLESFSACDSIWPCPLTILGDPPLLAVFAPAIAIERQLRLWLEE